MIDSTIIGQERIRRILKRLLAGGRLPHALLLVGPEGSGKAAAAIELGRAVLCQSGNEGACGQCAGCRKTGELNHADFGLILPMPARSTDDQVRKTTAEAVADPYGVDLPDGSIRIDPVRDLIRAFSRASYEGRYRSAVILNVHQMLPQAANALLKTLEEPPSRSLMVLTAPTPESVLPTILSRCQSIKFPPVAPGDVADALVSRGVSSERASYAAETSGGNVRRAIGATREDAADVQGRASKFLAALVEERDPNVYMALEQLSSDKAETLEVLKASELWLRDVLRYRTLGEDALPAGERGAAVQRLAQGFDLDRIQRIAEAIEGIRERNIRNVNLHLGLVDLWRHVRAGAPAPM